MKKIVFFLFALLMTFASCEGPIGPEGPAGPGTNWKILTFTVDSRDWKIMQNEDGSNPRFFYEFEVPEIDEFIYTDGLVSAYLYTNVGIETQTPLPYVLHQEAVDNQGNTILWTETYTYDYSPGSIAFYYSTFSDFFVEQNPPTMEFRVALMW